MAEPKTSRLPNTSIEIVGGDYEHVLGLAGDFGDTHITYRSHGLNEIFELMIAERAFEVCEFSLSNYLMLKDRGADWLMAIPVFPYRAFRHSTIYVRHDSPLRTFADLVGKAIAVPDYSMTAAVWTRGILKDQYGVDWSSMRWISGRKQRFEPPSNVDLTFIDEPLEDALINRHIDALLTTSTLDEAKSATEQKLRPLLNDARNVERSYFAETGIYPINHTVVVREDAVARLPQLPRLLFDIYSEAKHDAYRRRLGATLLPWGQSLWNELFAGFGGDPLPYGLTTLNRHVVETLCKYLVDQGLISERPALDELFVKGSLRWHL